MTFGASSNCVYAEMERMEDGRWKMKDVMYVCTCMYTSFAVVEKENMHYN